jgi:hypothetical protein
MTEVKAFIVSVMTKVKDRILDVRDRAVVEANLYHFHQDGFTVHETVVYLGFMEELGCQLDEDDALRRMDVLRKKVLSRKL